MSSYAALRRRSSDNAPLLISFLLFIALAIPVSILNVAWQYIHVDLGQPYDALGVLLLFFTAGRILSTFFAGSIMARLGMWQSVFTGMTMVVAGLLGTLLAPSWIVLLVSTFATAYGWGLMDLGTNLYIASRSWRGIVNFLHGSYGIGLTLGPLIVSLVVLRLGQNWRWSYLTPLVIMGVLWVWTFVSRDRWVLPQIADGESGSAHAGRTSIRATMALPIMLPWLLFALLYAGFEVGTGQLTSDLLTKSRGMDAESASAWVSLYWAAFTIGRFASGFVAGRFDDRLSLLIATVMATLGAVLLALPGLSLTLPGLLLVGVALAGVFPTIVSMIPRQFGPVHAPNVIGFTLASANIGIATLPGLGAFLAARSDFSVLGPFLVALGALLVGSHLLIMRRTTRT